MRYLPIFIIIIGFGLPISFAFLLYLIAIMYYFPKMITNYLIKRKGPRKMKEIPDQELKYWIRFFHYIIEIKSIEHSIIQTKDVLPTVFQLLTSNKSEYKTHPNFIHYFRGFLGLELLPKREKLANVMNQLLAKGWVLYNLEEKTIQVCKKIK